MRTTLIAGLILLSSMVSASSTMAGYEYAGIVELILLPSVVSASSTMAGYEYAGIVETDKGNGVYTLEERDANYPATPGAWGGAVAEFRRRHPDRKIISTTSIENKHSDGMGSKTRTIGIIVITDPK